MAVDYALTMVIHLLNEEVELEVLFMVGMVSNPFNVLEQLHMDLESNELGDVRDDEQLKHWVLKGSLFN